MKGNIDKCKIIAEDFNIPLSVIDTIQRTWITPSIIWDLINSYRTLYLIRAEYTFFPSAFGTITKVFWAINKPQI